MFFKSVMEKRGFGGRQRKDRSRCQRFRPVILSFFASVPKGDNPRHSPRAFPLGLLAPRYLVCRFSSHSRSAERVLGRHSVWGEEGILSPAPPRLVRPCFTVVADSLVKQGASRIRRDRARPTGGAQPLSTLPIELSVVSLPLLNFCIAR